HAGDGSGLLSSSGRGIGLAEQKGSRVAFAEAAQGKLAAADRLQWGGVVGCPRVEGAITSSIVEYGTADRVGFVRQRRLAGDCGQCVQIAGVGTAADFGAPPQVGDATSQVTPAESLLGIAFTRTVHAEMA